MGSDPGAVPFILGGAGESCERGVKMKLTDEQRKLAEDNIRLAYKIAWRFLNCGIDIEDLQGYAMLGLVKAAVAYDASRGLKFSTLAVTVIEREILYALRGYTKNRRCVSLDAKLPESDGKDDFRTLADVIPYQEDGFERAERIDLIPTMMSLPQLKKREKRAIAGVILQGKTQEKVGQVIGINQSVVSRYMKAGIRKMQTVYFGKEGVRR